MLGASGQSSESCVVIDKIHNAQPMSCVVCPVLLSLLYMLFISRVKSGEVGCAGDQGQALDSKQSLRSPFPKNRKLKLPQNAHRN